MDFLRADIVLTRIKAGGWVSDAVEAVTRDDPGVTFSHAALVLYPGDERTATLVEMTWPRGRTVPFTAYTAGDAAKWMVLRVSGLWPAVANDVARAAARYVGRLYPLGKLALQLADIATGSRFFTKTFAIHYLEVCSGLVARAYAEGAGFYFEDRGRRLDPESVRPDDIYDDACQRNALQVVAGNLT